MDEIPVIVGILGALVGAFVSWMIAERRITMQHVTSERTKWRAEIRHLAAKIHEAILRGGHRDLRLLSGKLEVRLNPDDDEDQAILKSIRDRQEREFLSGITKLLKHDWERVKLEANAFPCGWMLKAQRSPVKTPTPTKENKYTVRCGRVAFWGLAGLVLALVFFVAWCK